MARLRAPEIIDTTGPSSRGSSSPSWQQRLAPYCKPDSRRAAGQLFITSLPFLACMAALLYALSHGLWYALPLALPAAIFLVRLFIIQHDCGHGSYFKSRRTNETLGLVLSVLTLMPYWAWRRAHTVHHATSGNLDQRGTGDVTTLTVREYRSRSVWKRFLYRAYRHPLVLFGLGPAYCHSAGQRCIKRPAQQSDPRLAALAQHHRHRHRRGHKCRQSVGGHRAGSFPARVVHGSAPRDLTGRVVLLCAAPIRRYLLGRFRQKASGIRRVAAIEGSSYYDLPRALHWLTGSIGFHHIHHLASKVPNYRLRACFDANPEFQRAKRVTLLTSIKSVQLALWDEDRRQLVSFKQI